jgi:hypothetical protein
MKQITETQATGSVSPLAQLIMDTLRKSGTKVWAGLPTPEEREQLRAEKADTDIMVMKNRAAAKERHMEELKERARRKLRGEFDDEY